jgi:aspartate aminotransferase
MLFTIHIVYENQDFWYYYINFTKGEKTMVSLKIVEQLKGASMIRSMFEEGARLRKQYGAENVYDFSLGNPDPEPPEETKRILSHLIKEDKPGMNGYMNNAGYEDARVMIAESLNKKTGSSLTWHHIVMTCGAGGALNVVLKAILNPGDEVIALSPYFVEYRFYADNHGGKLVTVPTRPDDFQPDLDALASAITPKTKAIIINSPNNPTGVVYGEETLRAMSALLEKKEAEYGIKICVISDEPYREIVYDGVTVPSIMKIFVNAVVVYSFSKSLSLAGQRIGYIAVSDRFPETVKMMDALIFTNRILGYVNAPALFQRVAAESVGTTVDIDIYRERRDMLYDHLISLGFSCVKPQGAFYLFPKSPVSDVNELKAMALKHRIILVPGGGFGCPGHFRLAYCKSIETIRNSLPAWTALAGELNKEAFH